jgi:gas vesicle protein
MKMIKDFKEYINNSFKEIQESTGTQVHRFKKKLKEETHETLKEIKENIIKQVKEFFFFKKIKDLKLEIETIKKLQMGRGKPWRCKT